MRCNSHFVSPIYFYRNPTKAKQHTLNDLLTANWMMLATPSIIGCHQPNNVKLRQSTHCSWSAIIYFLAFGLDEYASLFSFMLFLYMFCTYCCEEYDSMLVLEGND
jgi:hypothetical protein